MNLCKSRATDQPTRMFPALINGVQTRIALSMNSRILTFPARASSPAPLSPEAHLFEVCSTVADPDPQGQQFAPPAWIPGRYLVRDFARHVVAIGASGGRRRVALEKIDKHSWRAAPVAGPLTVRAEVYAWDLSVRGAYLDTTHGFFNGSCVFRCCAANTASRW